jgi:hypothetical protein
MCNECIAAIPVAWLQKRVGEPIFALSMQRNLPPPSLLRTTTGPVVPPPSTLTHSGGRRFLLPRSPPLLRFRPLAPSVLGGAFFLADKHTSCHRACALRMAGMSNPCLSPASARAIVFGGAGRKPLPSPGVMPARFYFRISRFCRHRPAHFGAVALRSRLSCRPSGRWRTRPRHPLWRGLLPVWDRCRT